MTSDRSRVAQIFLNPSDAEVTFIQGTRMQSFFWKPFKPCHVGIHLKALTEFSHMSTYMPGFESFFSFLAWFCIGQISHQQHTGQIILHNFGIVTVPPILFSSGVPLVTTARRALTCRWDVRMVRTRIRKHSTPANPALEGTSVITQWLLLSWTTVLPSALWGTSVQRARASTMNSLVQ